MRLILLILIFFLTHCSPVSRSSLERPKLKNGFEYYAASVDSLNAGALEDALDLSNEAIKLNPRYAKFHLLQGDIYFKLNNKEKALNSYSNATKLRSGYVEAYLRIAKIYEKEFYNYDEAIKYYRRANSIDASNFNILLNIGECYYLKNEIYLAKNKVEEYKNLTTSQQKPLSFDYYFLNGKIHYTLKEFSEARINFENALELQPKHFEAKLKLVRCLFKLEDYENGLTFTNNLLNQDDKVGELYYFRALYYFHKNKFNDALGLFNQALILDKDLYHSHLYLGKIYELQGDKEKSIHHLQLYRKSAPLEEHIIDLP
jgi:tetratricopeptide (TPR) repeat protein